MRTRGQIQALSISHKDTGTVKKKGLLMDTWQFWGLNLGPLNYSRVPVTAAGLALSPAEPLKREMSSGGGDDSVHIGNDSTDTKDDLAAGGNNVLQRSNLSR